MRLVSSSKRYTYLSDHTERNMIFIANFPRKVTLKITSETMSFKNLNNAQILSVRPVAFSVKERFDEGVANAMLRFSLRLPRKQVQRYCTYIGRRTRFEHTTSLDPVLLDDRPVVKVFFLNCTKSLLFDSYHKYLQYVPLWAYC